MAFVPQNLEEFLSGNTEGKGKYNVKLVLKEPDWRKNNAELLSLENEFQHVNNVIGEKLKECEQQCVVDVLKMLLQTEPTVEDFKKCTRVFKPYNYDEYTLFYNHFELGNIQFSIGRKTFAVKFVPAI